MLLLGYRDGILYAQDNRQSLVLVKLEELDPMRLTKEMKYLVNSLTYLAWPQDGKLVTCHMRYFVKSLTYLAWPHYVEVCFV